MEGTSFIESGSRKNRGVFYKNGFMFTYQKTLKSGSDRWVCASKKKFGCKAFLKAIGKKVVDAVDYHVHNPETKQEICIARANVKKEASVDASTKPADIISRSTPSELGEDDVASLRRAIYRTRVACQKKTSLEPQVPVPDFKEPQSETRESLTADAVNIDVDYGLLEPKLEVVDPDYEKNADHAEAQGTSKGGSKKYLKNAKRQQSSTSNLTGPLTAEDLNILAEPAEEESGFENQECTEPEDKRVKVEAMEYFMDFPSGSSSSMRGDSRLSNDSFDSKPILANSSHNLDDDVVFESQTVVSSPIKPKTCSNRPGPKSKTVPTLAQIRERSDLFGEYVAAKLRSLKTDSARNRVECLIANILYEASRGTFDDAQSTTDLTNILQAYLNSTKDLQTPTDGSFSDSADVKPAASINLL
uniref:Uncharacterized protein n=1 Tax=Lygus hesperus TaxID=30085 RepID=A0A146KNS0_LYGHE